MRFIAQYMKQLPIPKVSSSMENSISGNIDKLLGDLETLQVNHLEQEIDARVASLYNLSEEEYTLILNKTDAPDPFRIGALNIFRDLSKGIIQ